MCAQTSPSDDQDLGKELRGKTRLMVITSEDVENEQLIQENLMATPNFTSASPEIFPRKRQPRKHTLFGKDAAHEEIDYEELQQSINPGANEDDTGTVIKKQSSVEAQELRTSRTGSVMQRSNTLIPDLERSSIKKIDQLEGEIILLNKLLEEKNILIEDLSFKKLALGQSCDAVTQTFERDLQLVQEVVQMEIEPAHPND